MTSPTEAPEGSTDVAPPSVHIIEELAKIRGCAPLDLEPLYDTVDLESLDALVLRSNGDIHVEVTIGSEYVCIDGEGSVSVLDQT